MSEAGAETPSLRIVGLAGSLRERSWNRALLRAAVEYAPTGMRIDIISADKLPFYNADVEMQGDPPAVIDFKASIAAADGLLIATPEYNDGIPGYLTTAIDWASRVPGRSPLLGKPVAIMGAASGTVGTARAQLHLRQVLTHAQARLLPPPELLLSRAHEKFDSLLQLTDPVSIQILRDLLGRFRWWIERERAAAMVGPSWAPMTVAAGRP